MTSYQAVIFDLGGVVVPSPFDAFDAYDLARDLPAGSVRALIRESSETGAWAALERGEHTLESFAVALEAEAAGAGFALDAKELIGGLGGGLGPRPEMTRAIGAIRAHGHKTAALTNNWPSFSPSNDTGSGRFDGLAFDVVVESAIEGMRKPDPRIYELVLARLDVAAEHAIFLDDLGINLKPARAMGITTIKVTEVKDALAELESLLGFPLGEG